MRSILRSRLGLSLIAMTLLGACAAPARRERVVVSEAPLGEATRLRADLARATPQLAESAGIQVVGGAGTAMRAELVASTAGADDAADAVARAIDVRWPTGGDTVTELLLGYHGDAGDDVRLEEVRVALPTGVGLDLSPGDADVVVSGVEADVTVIGDESAIEVRDADEVWLQAGSGSLTAEAETGVLMTGEGDIAIAMGGGVSARTGGGAIAGSFGRWAELETAHGAIDVELTSELDDDVLVGTGDGPISIVVPRGAAMQLELTTGLGEVSVQVGDTVHRGATFVGAVNGGGTYTVRAHTRRGSIVVTEDTGS